MGEDFLILVSSFSRFLFFFCLLERPELLGDPGVEDKGVSEVRDSCPDTELLELSLLEVEYEDSLISSTDSTLASGGGTPMMTKIKTKLIFSFKKTEDLHLDTCKMPTSLSPH